MLNEFLISLFNFVQCLITVSLVLCFPQFLVTRGTIKSSLFPILFNLYLNELPYILNNNAIDPILLPDGSHLTCLLYADDLLLISNSAEGLQHSVNK